MPCVAQADIEPCNQIGIDIVFFLLLAAAPCSAVLPSTSFQVRGIHTVTAGSCQKYTLPEPPGPPATMVLAGGPGGSGSVYSPSTTSRPGPLVLTRPCSTTPPSCDKNNQIGLTVLLLLLLLLLLLQGRRWWSRCGQCHPQQWCS